MTLSFTRRQIVGSVSAAVATAATPYKLAAQTSTASPAASVPQIIAMPETTRVDDRFELVAFGLVPGETVTIDATIRDEIRIYGTSTATYIVDERGAVDPSRQLPSAGSFDIADVMAFVWAASARIPTTSRIGTHEIVFRLLREGDPIAEAVAIRTGLPDSYIFESIMSPELVAEFYAIDDGGPKPAMIVLGGSEGGIPHSLVPSLLASHGYASLAVAYFGTTGLPNTLENIPIEYFSTAIEWLQAREEVDPDRIGVIGHSRGGELALLLGAYLPKVGAAISVNGSGLVNSGINWGKPAHDIFPAWTWNGEPIPYVDMNTDTSNPDDIDHVSIPVERTNGPVMLIAGEADGLWPSTYLARFAWERLREAGRDWPDEFLSYPAAGHIIEPQYFPSTPIRNYTGLEMGGSAEANSRAGADSWQAIRNMLAWRFRTAP